MKTKCDAHLIPQKKKLDLTGDTRRFSSRMTQQLKDNVPTINNNGLGGPADVRLRVTTAPRVSEEQLRSFDLIVPFWLSTPPGMFGWKNTSLISRQ